MSITKSSTPSESTSNILRALSLSLTLGLAPFYPEPHILGKVKWVMGGAVGMKPMDWFDFVLHGGPWVILIGVLIWEAKKKFLKT